MMLFNYQLQGDVLKYPGLERVDRFVTIDGTDGCGKTSTLKRLKILLTRHEVPTVFTKEPAGTELGAKVRQIILNPQMHLTTQQQIRIFTDVRLDHLNKVIIPAMKQHQLVICDRYLLSAMAYQGYYRRHQEHVYDANHVLQYNRKMINDYSADVIPDLNIYLQAPKALVIQHLKYRRQKSDKFDLYFQNSQRLGHLQWQFRCALREMITPYLWVDARRSAWWRATFIFYQIYPLLKYD